MGIPLDLLAPALDISSEFSRQASFSTSRRASLTLVLEGDRRTHPVGQSAIPRDCYCGARVPYLTREGKAVAVHFLARWAHLFRRELLQHLRRCGSRSALSVRVTGPLGGAFTREVTIFTGSAHLGLDVYKYRWVPQPLLLPPSAIVPALALLCHPTRARPRALSSGADFLLPSRCR